MAKFNLSALKELVKSIKLPTPEQLNSPRGRMLSGLALVAVSALIVGLSTLTPSGSNSANGNRPGSSNVNNDASQDYAANDNSSAESSAQPSRRPISGPMASAYESQQAESEEQKALRAEIARISNLGRTDTALVAIYLTLNNYLKATALAQDKGDAETKAYATKLEAAAKSQIAELEKLAKDRELAWPTLGVEPSQSDLQFLESNFVLESGDVGYLKNSSSSDFPGSFGNMIGKSVADLVDFTDSRQMPDDKEFQPLIKMIVSQLTPLAKANNN